MSREGFWYVVSMIEQNAVFKNSSNCKQAPPPKQLAVALRRLCTESSVMSIAQAFGISEGTVVLYTKRVVQALMDIWRESVGWHTEEERRNMKMRMGEDKGGRGWRLWEDCVGIVEGAFIPFAKRPFPQDKAAQYWNRRKKEYGLHATVICDDQHRILVFHSMFPGGCHDAKAFRSLQLSKQPENYFKRHEYLIGDSAYKLTPRMIVPFKGEGEGVAHQRRRFNTMLSKLRRRVEHTVRMLKARFTFLRCVPNVGSLSELQLRQVYASIGASVVIHNLLLDYNDNWEPPELDNDIEGESEEDSEPSGSVERGASQEEQEWVLSQRGQAKRMALLKKFLTIEGGGF